MTTALLIIAALAFVAGLCIVVQRTVVNYLYRRLYDKESNIEDSP